MDLLRSRNVKLEGGILSCTDTTQSFNKCALFAKGGRNFEYTAELLDSNSDVMVGIAGPDVNVNTDDTFRKEMGNFLYFNHGTLISKGTTDKPSGVGPITLNQVVKFQYSEDPVPTLKVSVGGAPFVTLPFDSIASGVKHLCVVCYGNPRIRLACNHSSASFRPEGYLKKMHTQLFGDSVFTDCVVQCGERTWHCHRAILAHASPVWRAALEGEFREGLERRIKIDDAEPLQVEALLSYAYMGEVNLTSVELMRLAHRYQMPDLFAVCAETMLDQLSEQNVAEIITAMNEFDGEETVERLWPQLLSRVKDNDKLIREALRNVKSPHD